MDYNIYYMYNSIVKDLSEDYWKEYVRLVKADKHQDALVFIKGA